MVKRELLEADLLIIGSGVAGLRAAIEGHNYGLDVLMVDKSLIARNSVSAYAGGSMSPSDQILMDEDERKRVEEALGWMGSTFKDRFNSTCLAGWSLPYFKDEIIEEEIVKEGAFLQADGAAYGVKYPRGTIWYHPPCRGYSPFILPLADYCKEVGVRTRTHLFIIDLIRSANAIVGAVGLDLKTGNHVVIKAKATVLASGGAARNFIRNNVPQVATGDGAAMAYRAGVSLNRMEAMQFDAWIWAEPGLPVWWIHQCIPRRRGVVLNSEGKQFLHKYIPDDRMHNPTFDPDDIWDIRYGGRVIPYVAFIARAMAVEVREGRGVDGSVLVDFTRATEEEWQESPHALANYNMFRDFDWKNNPIKVFPGALGTWGGVTHNVEGETELDRLFVGGEVGYSTHLMSSLVLGYRGGRAAARYAKTADMPELEMAVVDDILKEAEEIMNRPENEEGDPLKFKKIIQEMNMKYVGPVRVGEELQIAVDTYVKIQEENVPKLYARNPIQLRDALELKNIALFSEMMARSALLREETRGIHTRLDFPYMDNDNWRLNLYIRKNEVTGKPEFSKKPVVTTWGPKPPAGKIPSKGLEHYLKEE